MKQLITITLICIHVVFMSFSSSFAYELEPLEPGRAVKLYLIDGSTIKGVLEAWQEKDVILLGEDGEYAIDLENIEDAKYYLSMSEQQADILLNSPELNFLTEDQKEHIEYQRQYKVLNQKYEHVQKMQIFQTTLGILSLIGGAALLMDSTNAIETINTYGPDLQIILGLSTLSTGFTFLVVGFNQNKKIATLKKDLNTLSLKSEVSSNYLGLNLTYNY